MADFPAVPEDQGSVPEVLPPPAVIPYINDRNRAIQTFYKQQAFLKLAASSRAVVYYKKFQTAINVLESFGSAKPKWEDPVLVRAHVEHTPVDQNHTTWAVDERSTQTLYVIFTEAEARGMSNRDRFVINGLESEILSHEIEHEGMGDENFVARFTVAPSVDR